MPSEFEVVVLLSGTMILRAANLFRVVGFDRELPTCSASHAEQVALGP